MGVQISINPGFSNVWLPDGHVYQAEDVVDLTDAEAATLTDDVFNERVLTVVASIPDPSRSAYPAVVSVSEAAPLIQELDQRVTTLEGIVL